MPNSNIKLTGSWGNANWQLIASQVLPEELTPTACSGLAYFNNKVILTKNSRGWDIPGGHIEAGETIEQTLRREMHEEAGITNITSFQLLAYFLINSDTPKINPATNQPYPNPSIIPCFLVEFSDTVLTPITGKECLASQAFSISDPEVKTSFAYRTILTLDSLYHQLKNQLLSK